MATLICDIGGTNARFALVDKAGRVTGEEKRAVAAHPQFADALDGYLANRDEALEAAFIAAAGPVDHGEIRLTNANWQISAKEISELTGAEVHLLNDLEAVGHALPVLGPDDLDTIVAGAVHDRTGPPRPMLAVNVGTGFGAAVAIPVGDGWVSLATEAGHITLQTKMPDVAAVEHVFSGPGLATHLTTGRVSHEISSLFGRVVGDLVLATGAWGGVYLCGGVMTDFRSYFDEVPFLAAFRDKGAMAARIAEVPIHRITAPNPAFMGLAAASKQG